MRPTDFQFTVTIRGDERLAGAIRELAAHAAGYAQLDAAARDGLAIEVERATGAAIAASPRGDTDVEIRFAADAEVLAVVISAEAAAAAAPPPAPTTEGITVDWRSEGSRRTCHIRQSVSD